MGEISLFTIKEYNGTDFDTLYPETNSGQVLLDSTAQASTNLPSGSTLDDALQSITKDGGTYQIGDTLTTTRTNLGDKWLLCNGQQITQADYPVLVEILGDKPFNWINKGATLTTLSNVVNKITTSGDAFVGASDKKDGNFYHCYYSVDLLFWRSLFSMSKSIDVWCVGNTFIVTYNQTGASTYTYDYRYYSGEDVQISNFATINGCSRRIYGATYWNGKYYLSTRDPNLSDDSESLFIYDDFGQTPVILHVSDIGKLSALPEGVAIFSGGRSTTSSSTTATFSIDVVDAQNSITSYTSSAETRIGTMTDLKYFNGYYYIAMYASGSSQSEETFTLLRSASLSGNWSKIIEDTYKASRDRGHTITVTEDYLVTSSGYYVDKSNNLYKQSNPIISTVPILVGKDKYYAMVDTTVYESNIAVSANLPSISIASGLYTYIKAKN